MIVKTSLAKDDLTPYIQMPNRVVIGWLVHLRLIEQTGKFTAPVYAKPYFSFLSLVWCRGVRNEFKSRIL